MSGGLNLAYPKVTFFNSTQPESLSKEAPGVSALTSLSDSSSMRYSMTSSIRSISVLISCTVCPAVTRSVAGARNCFIYTANWVIIPGVNFPLMARAIPMNRTRQSVTSDTIRGSSPIYWSVLVNRTS